MRSVPRLAWALAALCAALALATAVLHARPHVIPTAGFTQWWVLNALGALLLGAIGAAVAARLPRNPVGWLILAMGVGHGLAGAAREYAVHALDGSAPLGREALWLSSWTWLDLVPMVALFLLFPDGRLRSRRWAPVLVVGLAAGTTLTVGMAVYPGSLLPWGAPPVDNPLPWPGFIHVVDHLGETRMILVSGAACALGVLSMLLTARAESGVARRRLVMVIVPAALTAVELIIEALAEYPGEEIVGTVLTVAFPAAMALAMLRYGLFELELAISRTLVYGGLTVLLGGAFIGLAAVAGALLDTDGVAGALPGAAVVTLLFAPVRERLQHAVDRLLHGERGDPYHVITSLPIDADDALPALAQAVAATLKLPYVAIETGDRRAAVGTLRGEPLALELAYRDADVGRLVLGRRTPAEPFSRAERRLLADLARQVAVAVQAAGLGEDLQRSRETLVSAREAERRLVRRNLHDGLGPALTGVALQLGAARTLVRRDPARAEALLEQLADETRTAIDDVRRLVYDLRPRVLDELGLVLALELQGQRFPGLDVSVEAAEPIDGLPPAIETAAYRIATEALTNVSRHAGASTCRISVSCNGSLEMEIADDGRGMAADWRPGVGVTSIRERAEELGGTCVVEPAAGGGTRVLARLPLAA